MPTCRVSACTGDRVAPRHRASHSGVAGSDQNRFTQPSGPHLAPDPRPKGERVFPHRASRHSSACGDDSVVRGLREADDDRLAIDENRPFQKGGVLQNRGDGLLPGRRLPAPSLILIRLGAGAQEVSHRTRADQTTEFLGRERTLEVVAILGARTVVLQETSCFDAGRSRELAVKAHPGLGHGWFSPQGAKNL